MLNIMKKQSPARIMAAGFAFVILLGSLILMLPVCIIDGVSLSYIDSLFISSSAVCVDGLVSVDVANTFSFFGQFIILLLIEIGGLGVTSIAAIAILAVGKKMGLKGVSIMRESLNLDSARGIRKFILEIFLTTLFFQFIGAVLSFLVFVKDFAPLKAVWVSVFHSIASFNNAGFDIIGNFQNLIPYRDSVLLNLTTSGLIIFGGIGFLVIKELMQKKYHWKKYSMHTKVVLVMTAFLLVFGTIMIKLTEDVNWLGAFFLSTSARTAGFTTYNLANFTRAGILVISILAFIGCSPGSTGGGIKTTTFFVLLVGIKSLVTNKTEKAFRYSVPKDAFKKASVIFLIALFVVGTGTYLLCIFEPNITLLDLFFEVINSFCTVGLSTGITPTLCVGSKIVLILTMFIGRVGPLTIASLWYSTKEETFTYPVGNISIG